MPRIPKKNDRYRTKDDLCHDLAFIIEAPLQYGTKYAVLSEATWVWTEFDGKYAGCRHWSKAAWELGDQTKRLTHEHVIPKNMIIERLLHLPKPSANSVHQLLTVYCKGAVVTREEDSQLNKLGLRSKMPDGWTWDAGDVWARYTTAGIVLHSH
jgi:hypothetical protein